MTVVYSSEEIVRAAFTYCEVDSGAHEHVDALQIPPLKGEAERSPVVLRWSRDSVTRFPGVYVQ